MDGDIEALRADPSGRRAPRHRRDRRPLRRRSSAALDARRSSWATPSAARSPRSCSTAASAPPAWRSTPPPSRACSRCRRRTLRSGFPVLKNPANNHRAVAAHARGVPLRVHQHADRGGVARGLRALRRARARAACCSRPRSPTSTRTRRRKVDFSNDDRAPLLFIAGGEDHVVPAVVDTRRAEQVRASRPRSPSTRSSPAARTSRSARTGWEEVADFALDWAVSTPGWAQRSQAAMSTMTRVTIVAMNAAKSATQTASWCV